MKAKTVISLTISTLLIAGSALALTACGTKVNQPATNTSSEPVPTSKIAAGTFYSVTLPDGWDTSDKADVYKYADGGSAYISVYNSSADELVKTESADEDFTVSDKKLKAGTLEYTPVISEKWFKAYYIAPYEDGCIEITVNDTDKLDDATLKAFLDGIIFQEKAYEKWQSSSHK